MYRRGHQTLTPTVVEHLTGRPPLVTQIPTQLGQMQVQVQVQVGEVQLRAGPQHGGERRQAGSCQLLLTLDGVPLALVPALVGVHLQEQLLLGMLHQAGLESPLTLIAPDLANTSLLQSAPTPAAAATPGVNVGQTPAYSGAPTPGVHFANTPAGVWSAPTSAPTPGGAIGSYEDPSGNQNSA